MRRRHEELAACSYCGAQPGQRCIVIRPGKRWGRPAIYPHNQRAIRSISTANLPNRTNDD